jgi:hypothetical protein
MLVEMALQGLDEADVAAVGGEAADYLRPATTTLADDSRQRVWSITC